MSPWWNIILILSQAWLVTHPVIFNFICCSLHICWYVVTQLTLVGEVIYPFFVLCIEWELILYWVCEKPESHFYVDPNTLSMTATLIRGMMYVNLSPMSASLSRLWMSSPSPSWAEQVQQEHCDLLFKITKTLKHATFMWTVVKCGAKRDWSTPDCPLPSQLRE